MNITEKIDKYLNEGKVVDWSKLYKQSKYNYDDGLDAIMFFFEGTKDDDNTFVDGIYGFYKNRGTDDKRKSEAAYKAAEEELFNRESEVLSAINSGNTSKIINIAKDVQQLVNKELS